MKFKVIKRKTTDVFFTGFDFRTNNKITPLFDHFKCLMIVPDALLEVLNDLVPFIGNDYEVFDVELKAE